MKEMLGVVLQYAKPTGMEHAMSKLTTTRHDFLQDRQGRMFADVLNASGQPCDAVLDFFICGGRQRPCKTPRLIMKSRGRG